MGSITFTLNEQVIYGGSRLGQINRNKDLTVASGPETFTSDVRTGKKQYELSNHLGNVLATISDFRIGGDDVTPDGVADYYQAEVLTITDYYPYGMIQPGRNYNADDYTFGYNGKPFDSEVEGIGVIYDYGFRIYDSRIARFISVDPLTDYYPFYSPYQFAANIPIAGIDVDGLELKVVIRYIDFYPDGTLKVTVSDVNILEEYSVKLTWEGEDIKAYGHTILASGQEFDAAETYVIDYYPDGSAHTWSKYEPIDIPLYPKPSASYDYSGGTIKGKMSEDMDYIKGQFFHSAAWAVIRTRDRAAPDNAETVELVDALTDVTLATTGAYWLYFNTYRQIVKINSYDDIAKNPKALWGKSKEDVRGVLGEGWVEGTYGSGGGWKFTKGDKSVFYNPGGPQSRHKGKYWGFSNGKQGKNKVVGKDYVPSENDKATIIEKN